MTDYDIDGLKHFFPARYRHKKMLPVINDFCSLLKSENFYPLPLIMKYVLFKALLEEISYCEEFDIPTISTIPQHDEIKEILQKDSHELELESLTNLPPTVILESELKNLSFMRPELRLTDSKNI